MLEIKDLFVSYGMMEVLHGISLNVQTGELVSVIGPNGAGKTTLIKTIMGLVQPKSGAVLYDGQDISHIPAHKRAEMGIGYVPEGRHVFGRLTVEENLAIGAYSSKDKEKLKKNIEMVYDIFPRLGERREQLARTMSGGEQQMLAIARGLMNKPSLLLLDEPSLGLAPIIVDEVFDVIKNVHEEMKIPILLVEQNAFNALEISSHAYVLEVGHLVNEGDSQELIKSPEIIKAYLGG